jgi:hypothetical protein
MIYPPKIIAPQCFLMTIPFVKQYPQKIFFSCGAGCSGPADTLQVLDARAQSA